MQIIQTIRDKGAAVVIAVIALSLIGFILMDANQGGASMFSSFSTNVGEVNGEKIEVTDFNNRVNAVQAQEERGGKRVTGVRTYEIREQMWNQVIAEKIFYAEAKKLGIEMSPKELSTILLSNDPRNPFMQEQGLLDESGNLDITKAQKAINDDIKKAKGEQRAIVDNQIIDPLKLATAVGKYGALMNASAYYPAWMQKRDVNENKEFAIISYVSVPYSDISDSSIVVTDAEISDYVKKNKELFKQEAGRMISYVSFSQLPNKEDSFRVRQVVEELRAPFAADTNSKVFLARNASSIDFDDRFKGKDKFGMPFIDSIVTAPIGTVTGPFVYDKNFVLAKVTATRQMPDTASSRHILIQTYDPQAKVQKMPDSTAKVLADSILAAVRGGADFTALAAKYSDDESSKMKGGVMDPFTYETMVPEFSEFSFTQPVGSKGVVKTMFGYHVMDVLSQKNQKPAYKIAFLAKEIIPGDATINAASLQATKASAEKDAKRLSAFAAKNGYSVTQVPAIIKENDYAVGNLQDARALVRWAFEAKPGDVSEVFSIGDQFVVATIDKVLKEGVQDAATARSGSEVIIRNEKKAEIIFKKLGNNPTLENAAASYNKQVMQAGTDSSITMGSQVVSGIGVEPRVIGAAFNKDYARAASPAFAGNTGVFIVKSLGVQRKEEDAPDVAVQRTQSRIATLRNQTNAWYEGLKKLADIKDKRSTHY